MISGKGKCPICGRPEISETAPFCSKRCANVDLQRWLAGSYVVPGGDDPDDGIPMPSDEA